LFPLDTVLFPGGYLPLRIFEQRYIDMVRDCSASGSSFGVCLIEQPIDATQQTHHMRIGTHAEICDWCTLDDGLLGITTRGRQKFTIQNTHVRDNGLLTGNVETLSEEQRVPLPVEFAVLASIASRFMDRLGKNYPSFIPENLQDAHWVGYRLAELLPLDNTEKQTLLQLSDPLKRLQQLVDLMPRFQS
jgi:hypothetical protein